MLHQKIDYASFVGHDIEFNKAVEDTAECVTPVYPEKGMRASVLKCELTELCYRHGDVIALTVSYTKFDEYNKQFESANYYDEYGRPVLTAREANFYTETNTLYVDPKVKICRLVTPELDNLVDEWKNAKQDHGISYSDWVSQKLIEARLELTNTRATIKSQPTDINYVNRLRP
jgi:hypothetical protein